MARDVNAYLKKKNIVYKSRRRLKRTTENFRKKRNLCTAKLSSTFRTQYCCRFIFSASLDWLIVQCPYECIRRAHACGHLLCACYVLRLLVCVANVASTAEYFLAHLTCPSSPTPCRSSIPNVFAFYAFFSHFFLLGDGFNRRSFRNGLSAGPKHEKMKLVWRKGRTKRQTLRRHSRTLR